MNSIAAASEDMLYPSDSERCSGSFEDNLGSTYVRHSVIMCLIVRHVPQYGHIGGSFFQEHYCGQKEFLIGIFLGASLIVFEAWILFIAIF